MILEISKSLTYRLPAFCPLQISMMKNAIIVIKTKEAQQRL